MEQAATLKQTVVRAVGWATATRLVAQLANWAMTLATIRFLQPQDYGLAAITMTTIGFVSSLSSVGITDAVVQSRRLNDDDLPSVFGLVLAINAGCLVLLGVLAYPVAWFYGEPRLIPLLQVASLLFVGIAFQAIPNALLVKGLDLKRVSRVDLVGRLAGGMLTLALAWKGAGVWSLLAGPLLVSALRAVGFGLAAHWLQLPRFSFGNLSEIIRFGGMRTVEQVLWNIYTSCDVFIIGRLLGPDVLGIYWVSRNLAALPVEKFAVTVGPAAMPAFALVQHDRAEALRYLRKAMRLLAFVCCPVFFGVAATAPQLVQVALGPKWSQASVPIALLAIGMALRPAGLVIAPFLMGLGEFAASLRNTIFATFLFPTAFVIGSHWGLLGVCAAWIVAYPLQLLALLRRVAIVARTSIGHLVAPLLPPLAGSLIMYAAVRGIEAMLPGNLGVWTAIIWLVGSGVLVYLGYTLLFLRPFAGELVGLARR